MDLWNDGTFLVFMTQHWDLQKQPSSLNFGVFVCFPTKVDKEMCPPGRSNPRTFYALSWQTRRSFINTHLRTKKKSFPGISGKREQGCRPKHTGMLNSSHFAGLCILLTNKQVVCKITALLYTIIDDMLVSWWFHCQYQPLRIISQKHIKTCILSTVYIYTISIYVHIYIYRYI